MLINISNLNLNLHWVFYSFYPFKHRCHERLRTPRFRHLCQRSRIHRRQQWNHRRSVVMLDWMCVIRSRAAASTNQLDWAKLAMCICGQPCICPQWAPCVMTSEPKLFMKRWPAVAKRKFRRSVRWCVNIWQVSGPVCRPRQPSTQHYCSVKYTLKIDVEQSIYRIDNYQESATTPWALRRASRLPIRPNL